ncbi:MAG: hypothetical protein QOF71_1579 [Candidatus Eremiobacteraeota bacterium]|jgi:hypothetical protein|nr:hypothetical protein [Candidatus Eremiobacteraeota bacterium]
MRPSFIVTSALVLALGATTLAGAQSTPVPVPTPIAVPTLPPNTPNAAIIQTIIGVGAQILQREAINNRNNARGTVSYFKRFDMQVQCGANCYRTVRLHQGTVINPRGATPSTGRYVDVNGRTAADGALEADTITVQQ